jgi:hypothetical protein
MGTIPSFWTIEESQREEAVRSNRLAIWESPPCEFDSTFTTSVCERNSEVSNHELMRDVAVADRSVRCDVKHLGAATRYGVDQWGVRIPSDPIEIAMMKKSLKPSVDSVPTLFFEETEKLRSRDKTVVEYRSKEFEVAVLKCDRRTVL